MSEPEEPVESNVVDFLTLQPYEAPLQPGEVSKETVAALQDLLASAEAGEIHGFVSIAWNSKTQSHKPTVCFGGAKSFADEVIGFVGALEFTKGEMLDVLRQPSMMMDEDYE